MVWVKICGITNLEDARMVARLSADAMGFILSTDSPRRVELSEAKRIMEALSSEENKILAAGVFVNEKIKDIIKCATELRLDYIQLSGNENKEYLKELKDKSREVKIIKSIRIKDKSSYCGCYKMSSLEIDKRVKELEGCVDFILLDSYRKDVYGGTGKTFDWDIAKNYKSGIPLILSGGLDPENVKKAIDIVRPFGVDASSRLEIYPGKKDPDKVRQFVDTVKSLIK